MNLYGRPRKLSGNLTGASAASAALRNSGVESPEGEEGDQGDGVNNELVLRYKHDSEQIWSSTAGVLRASQLVQSLGTLVINLMVLGYTSHQRTRS
jgi:hypothetical protein